MNALFCSSLVTVPPIIMYGPEETTVLELSAVTLVCVAEGDPVPSTTWIKEGHSLQTSDRVTLTPNGSLVSFSYFIILIFMYFSLQILFSFIFSVFSTLNYYILITYHMPMPVYFTALIHQYYSDHQCIPSL